MAFSRKTDMVFTNLNGKKVAEGRFCRLTEQGWRMLQKPIEGGLKTVGSFQVAEGKDV